MNFSDKKVIIFDLDGTLIDSIPDLALSINEMLTILNYDTYTQETIAHWVGNGASMLVKRALIGKKVFDEEIDENFFEKALTLFLKAYQNNLTLSTHPYPNVVSTLKKLHTANYRFALVTNKPFVFVSPILINLGIKDLFEIILGGDSLKEKKPSPMPLLHVCEKLNISIDDAIMVGDSSNDILSAKNASMQSIGVNYGYNYGEPIQSYNPTAIIENFKDILALFGVKDAS